MSNDETRDTALVTKAKAHNDAEHAEFSRFPGGWTVAVKGTFGRGFEAGWAAALASVPVPTNHTALIAEADEWVQEENWESSYETDGFNRPGTELIVRLRNALAALESQQGNTTSRSDEQEWEYALMQGDSVDEVFPTMQELADYYEIRFHEGEYPVRRTPAGPWVPVPTDKENDK